MAKDRERKPVSSDELIKRAWENIGGPDSGGGSRDKGTSSSEAMTSSANTDSTASTEDRTLAAEEIARLLREEEQARRPSARPAEPPRPRRATPSDLPPPRPRRSAPVEVPRRRSQPPRPSPPPPQAPSRQDAPPRQTVPPARGSARNSRWAIFAAVWAVLAIFGRFAGEITNEPDDVPGTLPATTRVLTPTTEPPGLEGSALVPEFDLESGMCIVWLPPGENELVATVPCAESHQFEVIAVVDAASPSTAYGSPDEVRNLGYDACLEEFPAYIGEPYDNSQWYLRVIVPTETEWVEEDDRATTCLVYQPGGDEPLYLEGTARGSGGPSA